MANTFKNASGAVGNTPTTIYTAPGATTSIIFALYLANIDGVANCDVTVTVTDTSAGATRNVAYLVTVPNQSTLIFDKPLVLEATDILKCTAVTTGDIEAYASVLEIT